MKTIQKLQLAMAAILLVASVSITSCKKTFDEPPYQTDPNLVANATIKSLKALHTVSGALDIINSDIIIAGTVVADDRAGNLYKQIYIQDTTGGIQLGIEASYIYGTFPQGRKVFVKCKGLCISDYFGTMQLGVKANVGGLPSWQAIPSNLVQNYVVGGSLNNPVVPQIVTLSQLTTNMQDKYIGSLIQLDGMQFQAADTSKTYGDTSAYKNAVDLLAATCAAPTAQMDVRSSGYANFAGISAADGNGSLIGIYAPYKTTKQLIIRDTSDVKFYGSRCGAGGGGGGGVPVGTVLLTEDFESQVVPTAAPYNNVTISGWNNFTEVGTKAWEARTFSANKYAYLTAFGSAQPVVTTWLVTKGINLGTFATKTLTFKTLQGFIGTGGSTIAGLKVLVSTNYSGTGSPAAAGVNWIDITSQAALSAGTATSFPTSFTNSGNINLNSYTGTLYVAFRYEGGITGNKTSTWEIDDITVVGN